MKNRDERFHAEFFKKVSAVCNRYGVVIQGVNPAGVVSGVRVSFCDRDGKVDDEVVVDSIATRIVKTKIKGAV